MGNPRSWQDGDPGWASGVWDSGSDISLGLCNQPVGTALPQGNQANAAEGGHPGGGAHPVSKIPAPQEGPACPTSWQVASSGPPASPHGDGQESHGHAEALEKGTWASKA